MIIQAITSLLALANKRQIQQEVNAHEDPADASVILASGAMSTVTRLAIAGLIAIANIIFLPRVFSDPSNIKPEKLEKAEAIMDIMPWIQTGLFVFAAISIALSLIYLVRFWHAYKIMTDLHNQN